MRRGLVLHVSALILAAMTFAGAVRADEWSQSSAGQSAAEPQRETSLVKLFADAAAEYAGSHAVNKARDIRLEVQIRMLRFMRESQQVQDWVGVVRTRGTTPEGDAWISIEIADGVTVSTWKTNADDGGATTLFRPGSKLFTLAQTAKIGQPVKFSGAFLSLAAASDEDMILRPQLIMIFTDIKAANG